MYLLTVVNDELIRVLLDFDMSAELSSELRCTVTIDLFSLACFDRGSDIDSCRDSISVLRHGNF